MNNRIPEIPPKIETIPSQILRPLWSVMIPTYNTIDYIRETITSVLIQDPGPDVMQIEVVDDCSIDGDIEALVREAGKGRVQFFMQKTNQGSLRNLETCIKRAKGHYVHLLHGDDRIEPGFYREISDLFKNHPEAGAAFTNYNYVDYKGEKLDIKNAMILKKRGIIPNFLFRISRRQLIQPPSIVVKRTVYETVGSFYAVHYGEDWEMWARIALKYPFVYSPKYLATYRVAQRKGISHNHFLTGQNIVDIKKVINIIQDYLPLEKRKKYKKRALTYYALFSIRIANSLLLHNRNAAFKQAKGAWGMSRDVFTFFWLLRFLFNAFS